MAACCYVELLSYGIQFFSSSCRATISSVVCICVYVCVYQVYSTMILLDINSSLQSGPQIQ